MHSQTHSHGGRARGREATLLNALRSIANSWRLQAVDKPLGAGAVDKPLGVEAVDKPLGVQTILSWCFPIFLQTASHSSPEPFGRLPASLGPPRSDLEELVADWRLVLLALLGAPLLTRDCEPRRIARDRHSRSPGRLSDAKDARSDDECRALAFERWAPSPWLASLPSSSSLPRS